MFELTSPEVSYMVGLFQTDGTHSGSTAGKGRLTLEISIRDADLLPRLQRHLPCCSSIGSRVRDTNFKTAYVSQRLNVYDQDVRAFFEQCGVPTGKKSAEIRPPAAIYSRPDYLRGIIDGDGSIGFTAQGYPFISLVTASPYIAQHFCAEVRAVCGVTRTARRNKRDSAFNIMVTNTSAVALARWCYPSGCLAMRRKRIAARAVLEWQPPHSGFGRQQTAWTPEEDAMLAGRSIKESAQLLGRTEQSVNLRRWRLRNSGALNGP
ncbi:hypothetical protein JK358_29375 [Nocardia sp. 2]|uniref:Homing endonuclease LAGLIDADG domain-containing protein n=1 Tax=Nocardia acididurans TaxID=2802282 RepID=A0ABS1MD76_9NOCA|nr:hypothetical protein [Nocardia acididurans]MBL1078524.1 hypothetical protein [Nocardia acididurans]